MDLLTKVINTGYFWGEFESTILSREILSKEIARTVRGLRWRRDLEVQSRYIIL